MPETPLTKFRPHRRTLADAMDEVIEVDSREALARHIGSPIVSIKSYGGLDTRIGWDTHIVIARYPDGEAVAGFTDGPLG